MTALPDLALSVRQPWAWAIIYAGKDVENRGPMMVRHLKTKTGWRAIHAAKGMTRWEYESARDSMAAIGVTCPPPALLMRGGIIGSVTVDRIVSKSSSRWFTGPRGLMLTDPEPCAFIPAVGALGYFKWEPADMSIVPPPARRMMPAAVVQPSIALEKINTPDLFGDA